MTLNRSRFQRVVAHVVAATRPFVTAFLVFVGTTCRDAPTQPKLRDGDPASFAGGLGGLTITPARDTILVGQNFDLSVRQSNGTAINKIAVWTSSDTTIAQVVSTGFSTGRVTGRAAGTVTITATSGSKDGTNTTVVIPVPVRSVTVAPDSASVQLGDSVQYTATPKDSAGNPLTGRTVVWSTVDTTVAKASATGNATTRARGATQVQATVEGVVGSAYLRVRRAQLTIGSISTSDSANAGDALVVPYTAQNLWDHADADSVVVRVGLRSVATNTVHRAVRRALPRIGDGATTADTAQIQIDATIPAGDYTIVAYVDCRDVSGTNDEVRLTECLTTSASAGAIAEGDETDNSRSASVVVRGPELTAASVTSPDTLFTRTAVAAGVVVGNSGSATATGFDVVAGLYDVTASAIVSAGVTTTAALASRESRIVEVSIAIPATTDPSHGYELRVYADCRNSGGGAVERLQACYANPATAGDVGESNEANNTAQRSAIVASNVARVDALPDSTLLVALGDTAILTATAFDRANASVGGVSFSWTSLDPAIVSAAGSVVRAVAVGSARVVAAAEGRVDTVRVYVVQQIARVVAAPETVTLGALGDTAQFTASVLDRNNNAIPGATVSWTSLDEAIATIVAPGKAVAQSIGSARIVASSDGHADTTNVSVLQQPARVVASPDSVAITALGDTARLSATAYDNNNNVVPNATFTWATLDAGVATVAPSGTVTAHANGVARIVAGLDGHADTSRVYVAQEIARVVASPENITLGSLGETSQLTAAILDRNANPVAGATATWTALEPAIAAVNATGLVTAQAVGSARVVASSAGVADTTNVTVAQLAARVVVAPDGASLSALGDTVHLSATVYDNNSNVVPGAAVSWTSLDPGVATVGTSGIVTAVSNGVARIVASSDAHADTTSVTVAQQVARVVAAPDTAALPSIGSTAQFSAAAFDRNDNAVSGASITWTSLDEWAATVSPTGLATSQNNGHARIVATSGSAADTVIANTIQVVASVVLAPDSAVVEVERSIALTPTLYDAGGNTVPGRVVSWTSLNPNIATASGTSVALVVGVAEGTASIVASIDGHADTAFVMVNPAGYSHRWLGTVSRAWSDPNNWLPHSVPTDTTNAYIAVAPRTPELSASADVASILIAQGAAVSATTDTLRTHGNIDANGPIVGWVAMRAPGTLRGLLGQMDLNVYAAATLAGRAAARTISVYDNGQLVVNGQHLDVEFLGTLGSGRISQTNAADTISVAGDARFYGDATSQLNAGVLLVSGNLSFMGPIGSVSTSGTHKVLLFGTATHNVATSDTLGAFQDIEAQGQVVFNTASGIKGRMTLASGANVSIPDHLALRFQTALPETQLGTYAVQQTTVTGSITLTRNYNFAGNGQIFIDGGGHLRIGGHKLEAAGVLTYFGTLTMDNPADTVIMRMQGSFYGIENLSAGTMIAQGSFGANPTGSPVPGASWNVSGTHKVVFAGTQPQSIGGCCGGGADTTFMHFQNLEIRNTTGVTFNNVTNVAGLLKLMPGAVVTGDWSSRIKVFSQLPDVSEGTYDGVTTIVAGQITATRNETFLRSMFVDHGGHLRLGGHKLSVGSLGTYFGTFTMDAPGDTLIIENTGSFYGLTNLSAGTIIFRGATFSGYPAPESVPGAAWNVSGTHKFVLEGTTSQQLGFRDTTVAGVQDIEIRNTGGVSFGPTVVGGLMKLVAGGKVTGDYSSMLKFRTQLPDIGQGVFELPQIMVTGNVTATRNELFPQTVMLDQGGSLRLGGRKLEIGNILVHDGTLTMDDAADTLVARDYASFYGRENLSAGTLIVQGASMVTGVAMFPGGPTAPSAWNVSGSHKTAFTGATSQAVSFSDTTIANFQHVEVTNAQGLTFNGSTNIRGLLQLKAGGKVSMSSPFGTSVLRFWNQLPDVSQGVYDVQVTAVAGQVTATRNDVIPWVWVETGGNLTLGGRKLDVQSFRTYPGGTLTMSANADTLIVRDRSELYGVANLSAGLLIQYGDFIIGTFAGNQSAFAGSGTHTTVFAGTASQNITMPSDGLSYFNNLKIDNASGVELNDSLDVRGQLMGSGAGVLRSQYGRIVKIAGGLDVAGLVLDGVWLDVNGGTLTRFDNVTFQTLAAPALLRIRHAGSGQTFTMNNINFNVPGGPGSYWIDAEDTDSATGALTLDVVSPQAADGPTYTRTTNGAVVTWRPPVVGSGGN